MSRARGSAHRELAGMHVPPPLQVQQGRYVCLRGRAGEHAGRYLSLAE